MMVRRRTLLAFGLVLAGLTGSALPAWTASAAEPVRIFAAASLKDALNEIAAAWRAQRPDSAVTVSYAASSALAKQIEQAAPADLFISADLDWMDYLDQRQLLKTDSRRNLLGNTLVMVAPAGKGLSLDLKPGLDLAKALGGGKLAMADVTAVPAGRYGKASLENLGLWDQVKSSVAGAENVRAALNFVARGEAPLGIVYGSDAKAEPKVEIAGTFPEASHAPIVYPAALVAASANAAASDFLAYLSQPAARDIFVRWGFKTLP